MLRRVAGAFQRLLCLMKAPLSKRAKEDARQTALIKHAWEDSGKVYGYRKLHDDLCDQGERCCPNRIASLAGIAGITAQIGYKRRPGHYGGKPAVVAESFFQLLKRERIRQKPYPTRDAARSDVFEYIEMFYNSQRKHTNNRMLSPIEFERQ